MHWFISSNSDIASVVLADEYFLSIKIEEDLQDSVFSFNNIGRTAEILLDINILKIAIIDFKMKVSE
jgi:hypothetical protein